MQRLRLVLLAATLLVAMTVSVLVLGLSFVGQTEQPEWAAGLRELPAGYVACDVDPVYGMGKADYDCHAPGPDTPQENILYCEGPRAQVDESVGCYRPGPDS